jgi:3-hydroxyisobutyrate dehydrogenase-like beta-hydroxyacid dehydrogenase
MARRLLDAGYPVCVYNRTPARAESLIQRGATWGATPAEAVAGADCVVVCVRDDAAARAVWLEPQTGVLSAMKPGALALESSTLTPRCAMELSDAASAAGIDFLEAPVVGSRPQAEAGQLVYLVGGEVAVLDRARPILAHLGAAIHHVGGKGQAAVLKLVVNAMLGVQVAALAELLGVLRHWGNAEAAASVLGQLAVTSPAARGALALMLSGNDEPLFPIELVEKDLRYLMEAAKTQGSEVPTTARVADLFQQAQQSGLGGLNLSAIHQLFA